MNVEIRNGYKHVTLSREELARAIETEPIAAFSASRWIGVDRQDVASGENDHLPINSERCTVCAVGAVLRQLLDNDTSVHALNTYAYKAIAGNTSASLPGDEFQDLDTLLLVAQDRIAHRSDIPVMATLSYYYEGLCAHANKKWGIRLSQELHEEAMLWVLRKLLVFVRQEMPETIRFVLPEMARLRTQPAFGRGGLKPW